MSDNTPVPEDDFKVEVVDDTPPEDRNRQPLPKEVVEELDKDSLDEYSDKVKTRISQMKKVWHDERRAKEMATREREEALAFAERIRHENAQLKQRLSEGEKVFVKEVSKAAQTEIEAAKENLKRAVEAGDSERVAAAQEAFTDAKLKFRDIQNFRPLQNEESVVQQPPQNQQVRPQPDTRAISWRDKNTWFGTDRKMTAFALGLHEDLVESGVDPRSDNYYRQVDDEMKKRFPEYFDDGSAPIQTEEKEDPAPRKVSTVVAPATRSSAPRQVRLTSTEVSIAKRLGLTPEAYAREKMKLENRNG